MINFAIDNHVDRPTRSFKLFLFENKCSLLFPSLTESPGDLTKDDTADDLDCALKVISDQWRIEGGGRGGRPPPQSPKKFLLRLSILI